MGRVRVEREPVLQSWYLRYRIDERPVPLSSVVHAATSSYTADASARHAKWIQAGRTVVVVKVMVMGGAGMVQKGRTDA